MSSPSDNDPTFGGEVIFADDRLRAVLHTPDNPKLVVTFDNHRAGKDRFDGRKPAAHLREAGYAQLHLETAGNDWFINPSTQALEEALGIVHGYYATTRAIGFSMGGYGALRFSGVIGVQMAVLVSPQFTIDRTIAPFEKRYQPNSNRFDSALGALDGANPDLGGVLAYDPFHAVDTAHMRLIVARFPRIKPVPMPFAFHPASTVLREANRLGRLQKQITERIAPGQLRQAHRASRRASPHYWDRFALQAEAKHPDWAARARENAQRLRSK